MVVGPLTDTFGYNGEAGMKVGLILFAPSTGRSAGLGGIGGGGCRGVGGGGGKGGR